MNMQRGKDVTNYDVQNQIPFNEIYILICKYQFYPRHVAKEYVIQGTNFKTVKMQIHQSMILQITCY